MNAMTQAVITYQETQKEEDFLPIWNHFQPKLEYMASKKAQQVPLPEEDFYESAVDGLLCALRKFDKSRGEFSTYLYTWVRGRMCAAIEKINRPKHVVNIKTVSFNVRWEKPSTGDTENEVQMEFADPSMNPEEQLMYDEVEETLL